MHSSARGGAAAVAMHGLRGMETGGCIPGKACAPTSHIFFVFVRRAKKQNCVASAILARSKINSLRRHGNGHAMAGEFVWIAYVKPGAGGHAAYAT